jgi:exosome complex exonuclease DIS3/RRP44
MFGRSLDIAIDRILYRLGIEGLITFKKEIRFDPEAYTVTLPGKKGDVTVAVFEKVVVRIKVERERNSQRGKVKMTLLSPVDTSDL